MKVFGNILIIGGLTLLALIFAPVIKEEAKYSLNRALNIKYSLDTQEEGSFEKPLKIPNTDFSIIISKIGAAAPIIDSVDSQNPDIYLPALRRGVAHAQGTVNPGEEGNIFLFAHSTDTFFNVGHYNAVFYLIGKLKTGDEIDIYYQGKLIKYGVYDKKVVDANSSQYFGTILPGEKTLTLQTCYPPGTTLKRLVVLAKQID